MCHAREAQLQAIILLNINDLSLSPPPPLLTESGHYTAFRYNLLKFLNIWAGRVKEGKDMVIQKGSGD